MTAHKRIITLAIICLLPVIASAEWERTISTWDTRLPGQGKLHVSLWGGYWESKPHNADLIENDGYLDVTYGLADNWSVCLSPSLYKWDQDGGGSKAGISDTALMTTYRFRDEATSGFDLAAMGSLYLPTGDKDKDLGTGSVEPEVKLLASKKLGDIIAVANLGARAIINADAGEKNFMLSPSIEGVYPLNDKLSLNAAMSASTARFDGYDALVDLGVGARFKPLERMFVMASVYKCLTDAYNWGFQIATGIEF